MAKLRFAVRKFDPFERAMEQCWTAYQTQYPSEIAIEFVPLDLEELTEAFFDNKGLYNGDWDIVHINTDWVTRAYETKGLFALDDLLARNPPEDAGDAWPASLKDLQLFDGHTYGLPFHDGPECLVLRKDLFEDKDEQTRFQERYGKALVPPKTWSDFVEIAEFFTRPDDNLYGTVFAGYPDGHNAVFDFCIQLWSRGGDLSHDGIPVKLDQSLAVEALDFYRRLFREPTGLHPKSTAYESVQAGAAFARGEVAMMVNWFGFASWAQIDDASAVQGKVDIASIPSTKEGLSPSLNVYWLYAIPEGSRHKALAYDFIRFAVNKINDKRLTLAGGVGCRYSTWHDADINASIPFYNKLGELHETARTLPRLANWTQIAHIIDEAVSTAIKTEEDSFSLLAKAQQKINAWI
ncbi:extracellular solute-binding protein [Sphingobacterium gobiense]|uniref:ABC transporter substrate-binding protein n=1 Tax=Sphingobacterium gobiense TaxID=1382456 RepID=A0A2S9JM05_9SPHI|nr:extracellular solute-binding protein [Sphingobacterium gobiense]PRD54193.1 ABC transporter substrate-binding protein [Sphingobacterium gobiense]